MKGTGQILWVPVVAYFMPGAWEFVFGIVPMYWPAKAFWVLEEGGASGWGYALFGIVYQMLVVWALQRRFDRVMRESTGG